MLHRLATVLALAAFTFTVPAYAAAKKTTKPAATKSTAKKSTAKKKAAATPTPEAVATPEATPAVAKKASKKMDKTFIRTHRAGWQEVAVGSKVIATKNDGTKVNGTIREVSDDEIVVGKTTIASRDLAQVFADPN